MHRLQRAQPLRIRVLLHPEALRGLLERQEGARTKALEEKKKMNMVFGWRGKMPQIPLSRC